MLGFLLSTYFRGTGLQNIYFNLQVSFALNLFQKHLFPIATLLLLLLSRFSCVQLCVTP